MGSPKVLHAGQVYRYDMRYRRQKSNVLANDVQHILFGDSPIKSPGVVVEGAIETGVARVGIRHH